MAEKLAGPRASEGQRSRSDQLARLALKQDPTAIDAIATLGLNAQIRGETERARRLLKYSQLLSRRDLKTNLWAIEDAVGRGDVAVALQHYDGALRTSRSAPDLLYPILAAAIRDPEIRLALAGTLRNKPAWTDSFIYYISRSGPDPRSTSDLFKTLQYVGLPISDLATTQLIGSLISGGLFEEAWSYYASIRHVLNRNMSRDPTFNAALEVPSPFDWVPSNEAGIAASIQQGAKAGLFEFAVPPGMGGAVLSQMQMLEPGQYIIEGVSAGINQPPSSQPYWVLSCRNSGELGRVNIPNSMQVPSKFEGLFRVPAGCPVQSLSLILRPTDAISGVEGEIHMVRLRLLR